MHEGVVSEGMGGEELGGVLPATGGFGVGAIKWAFDRATESMHGAETQRGKDQQKGENPGRRREQRAHVIVLHAAAKGRARGGWDRLPVCPASRR